MPQNQIDMSDSKVITGKVRFSYCHVFIPKAIDEGTDPKYSVSLIIPKSDVPAIKRIERAIEAAKIQGKVEKFGGKIPANLKTPLRDGDIERPEDSAYADAYFINATSNRKPQIVDADLQPIISPEDLVSGDYGRASVNFYPFAVSGNKGIAAGLNNLQLLEKGESLAGASSAADDFASPVEEDLI